MSAAIAFDADAEALRAELRSKEDDLLLAARYGKNLLEENEQLKKDRETNRQERANLSELLKSQKREYQRSMVDCRQTVEQHMSEMEQQIVDLQNDLAKERATIVTIKEEGHRSLEQMRADNIQLRDNLTKVTQNLEEKKTVNTELNRKLSETDKKKRKLASELAELQKQLEVVKELNTNLRTDVLALSTTCDQLNSDLANSKEESYYWEKKLQDRDAELDTCSKDLDDSQELLKQLQTELDQQSTYTPKSVRSSSRSASLYDELSSSRDSLALSYMGLIHAEDLSSTCGSDLVERDETCTASEGLGSNDSSPQLLFDKEMEVVQPEKCTDKVRCGWEEGETAQCHRCKELDKKLASNEEELKWVNDQLLMAVQQKFKLQQQIEAWQTDMTQVVQQQVQQKLNKGSVKRTNKSNSNTLERQRKLIIT